MKRTALLLAALIATPAYAAYPPASLNLGAVKPAHVQVTNECPYDLELLVRVETPKGWKITGWYTIRKNTPRIPLLDTGGMALLDHNANSHLFFHAKIPDTKTETQGSTLTFSYKGKDYGMTPANFNLDARGNLAFGISCDS